MALNWRDIQDRAVTFVHSYKEAKDEDRDAKPFWKDLFALYDVEPREIGSFEERVRMHGRAGVGKIDYFAPRKFLIEQKSRGKNLDEAYLQAMAYFDGLPKEDKPRHIIVCDFERMVVCDLEERGKKRKKEFLLADLPKRVKDLAFLAGEVQQEYAPESAVDVKAVRAIGKLYRALASTNYPAGDLSELLTRCVFCFFADDTGIFEKDALRRYFVEHTKEDGSDVGAHLGMVFAVLNSREDARQTTMHETLQALPYVNGGLFARPLAAVFGTRDIRATLLECMAFDWSVVSPAIFGSMFQSVMNEKERHDLGAHYTSEANILKVIGPLFLDDLKAELAKAKSVEKLNALWDKVASITLLDPACGCGNFLVVSYRELRRIEMEIVKRLDKGRKGAFAGVQQAGQAHLGFELDLAHLSRMSVERMYGIELERFPAEVAKLSLWLMDHMMNMELGAYYGKPLRKLPLTEAPHIVQGNALRLDWEEVVPKEKLTHILGNPPFLGKKEQDAEQKKDMELVWGKVKGMGILDYVSAWYKKASDYVTNTHITCAFVSTNSITQGEQVGVLWSYLFSQGIKIHFAHRTFRWSNEASGRAAVHCVIIGFGNFDITNKWIFEYKNISTKPEKLDAKNISPYLVDAEDVVVKSRTRPLCDVPPMDFGNMANDGGNLIFDNTSLEDFLEKEPAAKKYIRPLVGSEEFINGIERWCLWLKDINPSELRQFPAILKQIECVKLIRESSTREATRKLAETPYLFGEIRQPDTDYLVIPRVSSENRRMIPIGYLSSNYIVTDRCAFVRDATPYLFGILNSLMHMAWTRTVCGRLKSDYNYSINIVYNNFPWPEQVSDEKRKAVEDAAQAVLDARAAYPEATLADLYDPATMPAPLVKAHHTLDRAVDRCYGSRTFASEPERVAFLFEKYRELVAHK